MLHCPARPWSLVERRPAQGSLRRFAVAALLGGCGFQTPGAVGGEAGGTPALQLAAQSGFGGLGVVLAGGRPIPRLSARQAKALGLCCGRTDPVRSWGTSRDPARRTHLQYRATAPFSSRRRR